MSAIGHASVPTSHPGTPSSTRVLVVDDHQAVRLGVHGVLDREPGIHVAATAGTYAEALAAAEASTPDVAVVDFHMPGRDGLALTRRLKLMPHPPRVLIYSAFADDRLQISGLVAGADGVISKSFLASELADRVKSLARSDEPQFSISREAVAAASQAVDLDDRPILGMLANGATTDEMTAVLSMSEERLDARRRAMLERLKHPVG